MGVEGASAVPRGRDGRRDKQYRPLLQSFGVGGTPEQQGHVEGTMMTVEEAFLKQAAKSLAQSSAQE